MPARLPADCRDMTEVRAEIDRVDSRLVELIAERFGYVERAWQIKLGEKAAANGPWRNQQVIDRVRAKAEAKGEAARCLHCDCRSAGACAFQHYAQVYAADGSRFRAARAPFEQHLQPGGVIYEPGKCILCGICVKLTEMAGEPLGLTFIGRGFNVRIATPFDGTIEAGLQKTAAECVKACPTGALSMK